jgi:ubiquinone/menaquinone biosynthesis C-methylase UbiE/DNA-binding transcriptional ArsR family regulator
MNGWIVLANGFMVISNTLDWLQTLADATRVRLLLMLEQHELSVSELCGIVQLPQSTVSRHLKVLAEDDWVVNRREGTNQLYRLELAGWEPARCGLWEWVRSQADTPTTVQDRQRLVQILAQRSRSEAFFSSTAEQWDSLRIELFGEQLDSFALAACLSPDAVVAELGCGSAPLSHLVAPYVKQVIAVDNSSAMLAAARQRLSGLDNVRLELSSLTELSLERHSLDVAWLILVLPYLTEPESVFTEAARVLKRQRSLILVDLLPHERTSYRQEMGHVRLGVSREELSQWLCAANLRLTHYRPLPPDRRAKGPALFIAVASSEKP